jgi:hypothetical protein
MASTLTKELEEGFLSTTRKGQEIVLDALKTWVDTVQAYTPSLPAIQIPFADRLPKPEDVVTGAYDFAAQLLASQRKFAEEIVKATAELLPGTGDSAPKTPSAT